MSQVFYIFLYFFLSLIIHFSASILSSGHIGLCATSRAHAVTFRLHTLPARSGTHLHFLPHHKMAVRTLASLQNSYQALLLYKTFSDSQGPPLISHVESLYLLCVLTVCMTLFWSTGTVFSCMFCCLQHGACT